MMNERAGVSDARSSGTERKSCMNRRRPKDGEIYRHFRGKKYQVLHLHSVRKQKKIWLYIRRWKESGEYMSAGSTNFCFLSIRQNFLKPTRNIVSNFAEIEKRNGELADRKSVV